MFKMTIKTENEAFADTSGFELARLLRKAADQIETGAVSGPLMDSNGNKVGSYTGAR